MKRSDLKRCSGFLSYLLWEGLNVDYGPEYISYNNCVDKNGMIRNLGSLSTMSRVISSMTSYVVDDIINIFGGCLGATFPKTFVLVPTTITKFSLDASELFGVISTGNATKEEVVKYKTATRAIRGWLVGRRDALKRCLLLYPCNVGGEHWVLAASLLPFGEETREA